MVTPEQALSAIPEGLRTPLLQEFSGIINNFLEHRWSAAELSGGRFCEVVYTILDGHARGSFAASPSKPSNFVDACRRLENNAMAPRSFQILIPRLLPALYEIRNNRNVGHIGGDVNPDLMDSSAVVSIASWILAEMVRVFHGLSTEEAQQLVDNLAERRLTLVWKSGDIRRVLNPELSLKDQTLLLIGSIAGKVAVEQLFSWTGQKNRAYFNKLIRTLHEKRYIEFHVSTGEIELLPPGAEYIADLLKKQV
ncbi:MAG: hypothetical protein NTZ51_09075 [Proteobacteria bacterium]|nr:hypothetical protein [Pseudomonadota bacterium]